MKPYVLFASVGGWKPEDVERAGLTGAEEVLVYLARELARTGYRVAVCVPDLSINGTRERIVDGVRYTDFGYMAKHCAEDPLGKDTVLVSSMYPGFGRVISHLEARKRIFWTHSVGFDHPGDGGWREFDNIVCATRWQAKVMMDRYHPVPVPSVIPYGIVAPKHEPVGVTVQPWNLVKKPGKCLYASSPDRGLVRLLRWWPGVRELCPDATLCVAYGRERMRVRAEYEEAYKIELAEIESLLDQQGVTDLGFVSWQDINVHMADSEIWFSVGTFEETGCLIGQKAQVAGCVPIHSGAGCLKEIVHREPFWDDLKTLDSCEARQAFVLDVHETLLNLRRGVKPPNYAAPSWETVARKWDELLDGNQTK